MKFYKTDWFLRMASVVAAILIWFYVVYQENPTIDKWVSNIPIAQRNLSQDFVNGKLVVLSVSADDVDVKIGGRRRMVASINAASGESYIDMSKITDAGEYDIPINVNFAIDGLDVVQIKPNRCKVVVDRVVTEERTITVNTKGAVQSGHNLDNITINPMVIKLTGPQTEISKISSCSITVDLENKSDDIKGLYKVKLYDANGEEIIDAPIAKNVEYTDVLGTVSTTKNVPVRAVLNGGTNFNGDTVSAVCEPSTVTIRGKASDLADIDELLTETIDVSGIYSDDEIDQGIILPDGVNFANENDGKIKVLLTVEKADTDSDSER